VAFSAQTRGSTRGCGIDGLMLDGVVEEQNIDFEESEFDSQNLDADDETLRTGKSSSK